MKIIKVANRYPCPGPRYKKLGPSSGEEFREWIEKELSSYSDITIDLDGTEGYGSSFLEEAFGGLIRSGVSLEKVKSIKFISNEEPDIILEINDYINEAMKELIKG